ncbi:MAG: hypothetical protein UT33_C0013G0021 [Candidatus Peregrinibacteria bacterium GW2011_GWC2_39_14]|nr:MAG: hypothetical protein US92_C0007G0073 [Candidatus Peregrinibacteria bacterium GW2011_GWA2_38_36]KKR05169.1 MAG: hypothetical protein UT33_C0013G0021 [Candidatus Peregrinibacteria bacterium GW2011_GWC2_39_14]
MSLDDLYTSIPDEECPDERDGLNEPILTNRGNGQNRTARYEPANIFVPDYSDEVMAEDIMESTITKLAQEFQVLRTRLMEEAYFRRLNHNEMYHDPANSDDARRKREFLNNDDERHSPYPNTRYFMEKMLPTLKIMANGDPQALEVIARDAFECLKRLLYERGRASSFGGLVRTFFEPIQDGDITRDGELRFSKAKAFQYLYQKYGRLTAIAASAFQGDRCDKHHDGGDYSYEMHELEGMLKSTLEKLPPEYRDDALEVLIACEWYQRMESFWGGLPKVVEEFKKKGKTHLLKRYFELAKAGAMSMDSAHDGGRAFPFLAPKKALKELSAFEETPLELQDDIFNFAILVTRNSESVYDPNVPSFVRKKESDEDRYGDGRHVNLSRIADGMVALKKKRSFTDEKVREILRIPEVVPSVGHVIVASYAELDKKFPGGVDGLLKYLEDFKKAPVCARSVVNNFKDKELPQNHLQLYLDKGAEAVRAIGDGARMYFDAGVMTPPMIKILQESPRKFVALVDEAIVFALRFGHAGNKAFRAYAMYCLEPGFNDYKKGMRLILSRSNKIKKEAKQGRDRHALNGVGHSLGKALEEYDHIPYSFSKTECTRERRLPEDVNMVDHARIIRELMLSGRGRDGRYELYKEMVARGVDYRVAALIRIKEEQLGNGNRTSRLEGIVPIKGLDCPLSKSRVRDLARTIFSVRRALAKIFECGEDSIGDRRKYIERMPRKAAVEKLPMLSMDLLEEQLRRLKALEDDPKIAQFVDLKDLREEVEAAKSLAYFKDVAGIGILQGGLDIPRGGLLERGGNNVKALIAAASTIVGMGAMRLHGVTEQLDKLPFDVRLALPKDPGSRDELVSAMKRYERTLIGNIRKAVPAIEALILQERERGVGKMPVGLKVHTNNPMNSEILQFLQRFFGLDSTMFHLIHADHSLVLPVMVSEAEMSLTLAVLSALHVIEEEPDLQYCGAGEQPEKTAGIIGASTILSAIRSVPSYEPGAFRTTHNQTGARIMCYGDGVRETDLPFDVAEAGGRTDILGRRCLGGIGRFRLLTTLANHGAHNKRFGDLMGTYVMRLKGILHEYGLLQFLYESAWIFDTKKEGDSIEAHERMVNRFMQAWTQASRSVDFGVIREVNELLNEMEAAIQMQREAIIREQPDDYQKLLTF